MNLRVGIAGIPLAGPTAVDLLRFLRSPRAEAQVWADFVRTRREVSWLRSGLSESSSDAPRLLVISLTDMVHQLKVEAMFAAAMRRHGWRPVVLTNSQTNTRARRYFAAFGVREFAYLDDYAPTPAETDHAAVTTHRMLQGDLTFASVKEWTFDGCWIGPQILASVSREEHRGSPDPADPEIAAQVQRLLSGVLLRVLIARRVVDALKPDLGMVVEANYAGNSPFVDRLINSGTDVIQIVQPWRDDAITAKRLNKETRRVHPSSVSPETLARVMEQPWTEVEDRELDSMFADRYGGRWFLQARNQPSTRRFSNTEIVTHLQLNPEKKAAVVFSHILWDANLFYGADLFKDYGDWFIQTVAAACNNPRLNWLIKLHPANLWKRARDGVEGEFAELELIREHLGDLPDYVRILPPDTDIDTLSLFRFVDYGVTVRGTAGMELPCFGKPTLTAGTGRYTQLGFTVDFETQASYLAGLAALEQRPPMSAKQVELARRHAHAAFIRRPWLMKSFKSTFDYLASGWHPLDHNLNCVVRSLEEAESNGDLGRWARWAAGAEVDYLEPRSS